MAINLVWPVALIVLSNVFYQICAKAIPGEMNPFAYLTITYLVGAVFSVILFFATSHGGSLLAEYQKTNWAPFVLGLAIVGLEAGFLYGYRAGWQVNTLPLLANTLLAIVLIFVGWLLYKETFTIDKAIGIALCLGGLFFIKR